MPTRDPKKNHRTPASHPRHANTYINLLEGDAGSVSSVLGSVLSALRVAKTLQGDPTTHPPRTQEGGAGDFSWGAARAFNTQVP